MILLICSIRRSSRRWCPILRVSPPYRASCCTRWRRRCHRCETRPQKRCYGLNVDSSSSKNSFLKSIQGWRMSRELLVSHMIKCKTVIHGSKCPNKCPSPTLLSVLCNVSCWNVFFFFQIKHMEKHYGNITDGLFEESLQ